MRHGLGDELRAGQGGHLVVHQAAAGGSPAAVFDQRHLAVGKIVVGDVVEQIFHGDEHAGVVGGGGKDQVAVFESVGEYVAGGRDGGVVHLHVYAAVDQLGGQDVGGVLGVAVYGGVGQQYALLFGV
jgi:hypothetical protein